MSHSEILGWDLSFAVEPQREAPDHDETNIESLVKVMLDSATDDTVYELAFENLEQMFETNPDQFYEDWKLYMK